MTMNSKFASVTSLPPHLNQEPQWVRFFKANNQIAQPVGSSGFSITSPNQRRFHSLFAKPSWKTTLLKPYLPQASQVLKIDQAAQPIVSKDMMKTIYNQSSQNQFVQGLPQNPDADLDLSLLQSNPQEFFNQADFNDLTLLQTAAHLSKNSPEWHHQIVAVWIENLNDSLLLPDLLKLSQSIGIPRADNFTSSKRTPWGGQKIRKMMSDLGIPNGDIVGEAWSISGHSSFPSRFVLQIQGKLVEVPLWLLGQINAANFYGKNNVQKFANKPPFLTKVLNSGSIQEQKGQILKLLSQKLSEQDWNDFFASQTDCQSQNDLENLNNHDCYG